MATMNMTEFKAAEDFLRSRLPQGGRLLAAVSGGLDSMCLLHWCMGLSGFTVTAAHFNHRLRAAAEGDQAFVEDWCAAHHIPCLTGAGDTRQRVEKTGETVEEAARNLRYAFLESAGAEYDAILTAHHADDNAETVLLNLLRGTGTAGLGIPRERGKFLRPFLGIEKGTLEAYAKENHIPHVEDETNQWDDGARNVLRHHVLPVLKDLNPRAAAHISRAAAIAAEESEVLEELARETARTGTAQALLEAPEAVASRAALMLLGEMAGGRKNLTARHAGMLLELVRRGRGEAHFPQGVHARMDRDGRLALWRQEPEAEVPILLGQGLLWRDWEVLLTREDNGGWPLTLPENVPLGITAWEPSDRMRLPGSRGARSIKRLCADKGIPPHQRDSLPVLRAGAEIAAMARVGINAHFAPQNENTVYIKFMDKGEHK